MQNDLYWVLPAAFLSTGCNQIKSNLWEMRATRMYYDDVILASIKSPLLSVVGTALANAGKFLRTMPEEGGFWGGCYITSR